MIDRIARFGASVALVDTARQRSLTYSELASRVENAADRLARAAGGRALVFLVMGSDAESIVLYLACLSAGLPVFLADPRAQALERLAEIYRPRLLLGPASATPPAGYGPCEIDVSETHRAWLRESDDATVLHPSLALLLSTSGSTGSPKLVRLTRSNIESNAASIAEYLGLSPDERAVQSLPFQYSYGLSVLNSHLIAGGSVVLTESSFLRPEFWSVVDEFGCTSFAGVPYMYETLHRLRFAPERHATLRTLTQAGGGLRRELITHFLDASSRASKTFCVMYGQTEATARIAYVPPERLSAKIGSIGIAIPRGRMSLAPAEGQADLSELVYEGPNVMLGYAESRADLALGDVEHGMLRTGDLARSDADGFFFIEGRLKRIAKLFGSRINLEEVERELESRFPVKAAVLDGGERLIVYVVADEPTEEAVIAVHLARFLAVPPGAFQIRATGSLPLTPSGKKDYRSLEDLDRHRGAAAPQRP